MNSCLVTFGSLFGISWVILAPLLLWAIYQGRPVIAALATFMAGPGAIVGASLFEGRDLHNLLANSLWAWPLTLADMVALPLAAAWLALAFRKLPKYNDRLTYSQPLSSPWYRKWWWPTAALFIGVVCGTIFHLYDAPHYPVLEEFSPGKLTHDFLTYVIISAAIIYGGVPTFMRQKKVKKEFAWALVCWLAWVAAVLAFNLFWDVAQADFHVPFNYATCSIV